MCTHLLTTFTATKQAVARAISPEFNSECFTYTSGNIENVLSCYYYLQGISSNTCAVNGDNVQFCYAGDAQVTGSNVSGGPSASSLW